MNILRSIAAIAAMACAMPSAALAQDAAIRIAVVDSGVYEAPVSEGVTIHRFDARDSDGVVAETETRWRGSHGTLVTSIIIDGTDEPVDILAYRAERRCQQVLCEMNETAIVRAVEHAAANGAKVIQMSLYGRISSRTRKALAAVAGQGIHLVLCAGNEGGRTTWLKLLRENPEFVHVIGALDAEGQVADFSADGGRWDDLIDYRLGVDIPATDFAEATEVTGTSFSASLYTLELIDRLAPAQVRIASTTAQQ